ncbi:MAG: DUF1501 domain-containing protein [Deltaproteobacteria bacterium]|nr:DUF1501 domain-containing protein [Deltaproteobacteria bacterium]
MIDRRQFLKSTLAASAAISLPNIWLRARQASALEVCEQGVNLVLIQLDGGNDGLNMVVPFTDGTGQNRSVYQAARPYIAVPQSELGLTQIGNDPLHNGQLALHPHMDALKGLYSSGNLAVVLSVQYNNPSLSHDVSKSIWYRADPPLTGAGSGWIGRTLDSLCTSQPLAVPAVDANSQLSPLFYGNTSVLAFGSIGSLNFPTSHFLSSAERTEYKGHFTNIYSAALNNGPNFLAPLGSAGYAAASKIDDYKTISQAQSLHLNDLIGGTTSGGGQFAVPGVRQSYSLANQLRMIFGLMRGKQPGNVPLGCRIFRASIGGFDSHGNQGNHVPLTTKTLAQKVTEGFQGEYHGQLMHRLDKAIGAFWQDLVDQNMHGNTVLMTFTEFGRRIDENGTHDTDSGTDHGTASPMFVIGPTAAQSTAAAHLGGGIHSAHAELDHPNNDGNMVYQLDFRHVYGDILNKWLGVPLSTTNSFLGAGGFTYSPQGILV